MSNQAQQLLLKNFFSSYFHEDWMCDMDNPDGVVSEYIRFESPNTIRELGEAILSYLVEFDSDVLLEDQLFIDLGCYYRPSLEGVPAKIWLKNIANQLLKNIHSC